MRTTISIEDSILEKAKMVSRERRCSLREVIEDALRAAFAKGRKTDGPGPTRPFKTFKGSGLHPGIDLAASSALLDAMESK
ncbi:MAG: hypothetical protein ABIR38_00580 [Chthoniobacterales bacterium]